MHWRSPPDASSAWRFGGAWTGVSPILVRIHTDERLTGVGARMFCIRPSPRPRSRLSTVHFKWCIPHNSLSGVGSARHLHLSAALPNVPYIEYMYEPPGCTPDSWQVLLAEPLRADKVRPIDDEGLVFHQALRAPTGPGLGIEANEALVDEEQIAAYAIE